MPGTTPHINPRPYDYPYVPPPASHGFTGSIPPPPRNIYPNPYLDQTQQQYTTPHALPPPNHGFTGYVPQDSSRHAYERSYPHQNHFLPQAQPQYTHPYAPSPRPEFNFMPPPPPRGLPQIPHLDGAQPQYSGPYAPAPPSHGFTGYVPPPLPRHLYQIPETAVPQTQHIHAFQPPPQHRYTAFSGPIPGLAHSNLSSLLHPPAPSSRPATQDTGPGHRQQQEPMRASSNVSNSPRNMVRQEQERREGRDGEREERDGGYGPGGLGRRQR